MNRWKGKVAVVSGASAGVGAEITRALGEQGVTVIGLSRKHVKLQVFIKENHTKIHSFNCDVANEESIIETFKLIEEQFGGVDIMINNAGISKFSGLVDGESESWKEMLDINVMAMNICNREALKSMRRRGDDGYIININSIAGHRISPTPNLGMYTATKYAVTALTQCLRNDLRNLGSDIRVASISPGLVATDASMNPVPNLNKNIQCDFKAPPSGYLAVTDVSQAIISILSLPQNVEIVEMVIKSK
ncbi:farnesol dehydrogenase-like [Arctopsyche grandis]|uniref:farnesol dehydrogenase-like n=1 Tax=Arctopsyche grandis TaxID=121162 RepID=UPI00406D9FB3